MRRRGTRRDESGAVAVMVALLTVVLFGAAALSVDLGNAWARKRAVQKQVDVSALAAGSSLPAVSLADRQRVATDVADWLTRNRVAGQPALVTAADLLDSDRGNGHIEWLRADGSPCLAAQSCDRIRVISPSSTVDFGLAGVFGASEVQVQREASVIVASEIPDPVDLVPFWLPSGCASGPAWLDTSNGNPGKFSAVTTGGEAASEVEVIPDDVVRGTHQIVGPLSPPSLGVGQSGSVSGIRLTGIPSNVDRASIRFVAPDGTWHEYAAVDVGRTDPLVVPGFEIGTEVTSVPGTWRVFGVLQQKNDHRPPMISANHLPFTVLGEAPPVVDPPTAPVPEAVPVGCWGQERGNFGQLDSPRKDATGNQLPFALNIAKGFDHTLVPFVFDSPQAVTKDCGKRDHGIPGARQDTTSVDDRNCILSDPGNDPPSVTKGFVTGVDGTPGRLAAVRGTTTRGGSSCGGGNDTVLGVEVNNDLLSCFLPSGASLESITGTGPGTPQLDPAVTASPRFVWVPVVVAADRTQKNFQPILEFAPGFITSEQPAATRGAPGLLPDDNGLLATDQQLKGVQVFIFSKDALPVDERNPTTAYATSIGRKVVRLVD